MERLTIHNGMYKRLDPEQAEAIYKKLRAYEDTGLEPEQCAKYAQAEKEGRYIVLKEPRSAGVHRLEEIARADIEDRLVVLPCKVGDTVYKPLGKNEEILPIKIQWFETNNYGWCACGTYPPRATYALRFADLGKTWFTDRAEAEKAMEVKKLIEYLRQPKCPNVPKYFCADCIHSDMHWDGTKFRGFSCRLKAR